MLNPPRPHRHTRAEARRNTTSCQHFLVLNTFTLPALLVSPDLQSSLASHNCCSRQPHSADETLRVFPTFIRYEHHWSCCWCQQGSCCDQAAAHQGATRMWTAKNESSVAQAYSAVSLRTDHHQAHESRPRCCQACYGPCPL